MLHELQHVSGSFIIKIQSITTVFFNIFYALLWWYIYVTGHYKKLYLKEINVLYEVKNVFVNLVTCFFLVFYI